MGRPPPAAAPHCKRTDLMTLDLAADQLVVEVVYPNGSDQGVEAAQPQRTKKRGCSEALAFGGWLLVGALVQLLWGLYPVFTRYLQVNCGTCACRERRACMRCTGATPRGDRHGALTLGWSLEAAGGDQPPSRSLPAHAHDCAPGNTSAVRHGHCPAAADGEHGYNHGNAVQPSPCLRASHGATRITRCCGGCAGGCTAATQPGQNLPSAVSWQGRRRRWRTHVSSCLSAPVHLLCRSGGVGWPRRHPTHSQAARLARMRARKAVRKSSMPPVLRWHCSRHQPQRWMSRFQQQAAPARQLPSG